MSKSKPEIAPIEVGQARRDNSSFNFDLEAERRRVISERGYLEAVDIPFLVKQILRIDYSADSSWAIGLTLGDGSSERNYIIYDAAIIAPGSLLGRASSEITGDGVKTLILATETERLAELLEWLFQAGADSS